MSTTKRSPRAPGGLLAGVGFALWAVLILSMADAVAVGFVSDDAYYYFKIARSIVTGGGSTFDGMEPTNGYHPAWMAISVAVFAFAGDDVLPVALMIVISGALGLTAVGWLRRVLEESLAPGTGDLAAAVTLPAVVLGGIANGMETILLFFFVCALVFASHRHGLHALDAPPRKAFLLGLLLGGVFLSRLDAAFVVLAAGVMGLLAAILVGQGIRIWLPRLSAMTAGVLLLAVPYFGWNWLEFGHFVPISGTIKSGFPRMRSPPTFHGDLALGALLTLVACALAVAWLVLERRRGARVRVLIAEPTSFLVLGCAVHFVYSLMFMTWGVYWWHFLTHALACLIVGSRVLALVAGMSLLARFFGRPTAAMVGVAGLALQFAVVMNRTQRHVEWRDAAYWFRDHTPAGTSLGLKDAGLFGYFSQRPVINLDGKANGYDYFAHLSRGEVREYLVERGVTHLADVNASYSGGRAVIVIPRGGRSDIVLDVAEQDEVYGGRRSRNRLFLTDDTAVARVAIWTFAPRARP